MKKLKSFKNSAAGYWCSVTGDTWVWFDRFIFLFIFTAFCFTDYWKRMRNVDFCLNGSLQLRVSSEKHSISQETWLVYGSLSNDFEGQWIPTWTPCTCNYCPAIYWVLQYYSLIRCGTPVNRETGCFEVCLKSPKSYHKSLCFSHSQPGKMGIRATWDLSERFFFKTAPIHLDLLSLPLSPCNPVTST